jgi:hypothetical protein
LAYVIVFLVAAVLQYALDDGDGMSPGVIVLIGGWGLYCGLTVATDFTSAKSFPVKENLCSLPSVVPCASAAGSRPDPPGMASSAGSKRVAYMNLSYVRAPARDACSSRERALCSAMR